MKAKLRRLIKKVLPEDIYNKLVLPKHYFLAMVAVVKNGFPARGMKVIGVTGTNGKTTTSVMLASILNEAGLKTGLITSQLLQIDGEMIETTVEYTTPSADITQSYIKKMRQAGVTHLVLETASHGLAQKRVFGIPYFGAVFTNLTPDHLDYHKTMENYAATKRQLFKKAKNFSVLNADSDWYNFMNIKSKDQTTSYSFTQKGADISVDSFELAPSSAKMEFSTSEGKIKTSLQFTGKYNVANAMAAAGAALKLGISTDVIAKGLANLKPVSGRMETIDEGQDFAVYIDNAHTGDSLSNLIGALQDVAGKSQVIVLCGADGDRGPDRRIPLGEAVGKIAPSKVIVSDQEPYSDNPDELRADVIKGLENSGYTDYIDGGDRTKAINLALKQAKKSDIVLIAGIGAQPWRGMGEGKEGEVKWDERTVVRKAIKSL